MSENKKEKMLEDVCREKVNMNKVCEDEKVFFSQKELNKIIAEQKRKFNKSQEQFLNDIGVETFEELREKIMVLHKEIELCKLKEYKINYLIQVGLSSEYIDFIHGDDKESISKNIDKLYNVLNTTGVIKVNVNPEKKVIQKNDKY